MSDHPKSCHSDVNETNVAPTRCCESAAKPAEPAIGCCAPAKTETAVHTHAPEAAGCCPETKRRDYLLWGGLCLVVLLYGAHLSALLPHDGLGIAAHTVFELINTMWWGVVIAALFVGLLAAIPQSLIMGILGQGGSKRGVFRATAAGLLLDLCSHGVLMVGMQLYKRGASLGQVMAFLIATPWNSLSLTIIMIALIGLPWTLAFIGLSLLIGLVTGLWIDRLVATGRLPANPHHEPLPADFRLWPAIKAAWAGIEWRWGLVPETLWRGLTGSAMVIRWLLVGVLLAALVRALMDPALFSQWFGPTLLGLAATLVAATIIEVCSEGSTPLAAELMTRGGAPGNAFTFMMAGVSTDYTEIMSLKDTTGQWRLALALPLYTLPQILVVGWLLNSLN
ncbi:permease [Simiduia agarivorans]|uniref:Permease n=1 Tax=Simiduia agarivorans (strain DSM 21679 / JCM 13881 / BCRC 17597 / SA1) TaxID=1117647 RepID=K4KG08_SIMAS|nr:permease [Simiduia agarivorans]AFU97891.1 permease [Simiduia agarivorans SA1 = DSM 21679]